MSDEFLVKAAEKQQLTVNMQELGDLTQQLVELRRKITQKELELASLNLQETKLSKEIFPQYLAKYGFKDLSLLDGRKITIKKDIFARIPKEPAKRREALAWLKEHGGGELIKSALVVDDPSPDLIEKVQEMGLFYSQNEDVVTNSLLAFLREVLGLKKGAMAKLTVSDLSPALGAYINYSTEIKE